MRNKLFRDIPKKVDKLMPLEYCCEYFQMIVSTLNKVLGINGTMNITGAIYIIVINIQDMYTNVEYDCVKYIITVLHNGIITLQ